MRLGRIVYFFREAFNSLSRNRLLTLATISTVSICILILGMAVLLTLNAGNFMNRLESDVQIIAYLDKSLTRSQIEDAEEKIRSLPGIESVEFVSREEGMKKLQDSMRGREYDLEKTLSENPLPHAYDIKAENPHEVPELAAKINKIYGIYKVNYGKGVVERLFKVTRWVRIISMIIIGLLGFGAVFLIATTIRLAIYARRKEIYLMKLIGATDGFIRWPFFIEGVVLGILGSAVSILLLAVGYGSLVKHTASMAFLPLVNGTDAFITLYGSLLLTGAVLGVLGTMISVNRFLDV